MGDPKRSIPGEVNHLELWLHPHEEREREADNLVAAWEEYRRRYGGAGRLTENLTQAIDSVCTILRARYQMPDIFKGQG